MTLALTYPQAGLYMREREALDAIERDETQRLFHESQREVVAKSKRLLKQMEKNEQEEVQPPHSAAPFLTLFHLRTSPHPAPPCSVPPSPALPCPTPPRIVSSDWRRREGGGWRARSNGTICRQLSRRKRRRSQLRNGQTRRRCGQRQSCPTSNPNASRRL